jgi:hypothetical protein
MQSKDEKHSKKRVQPEDAEMGSLSTDDQMKEPRQFKKAKRRTKEDQPIIDEETGEQIEFEDDSDDGEVYMDEQEVV